MKKALLTIFLDFDGVLTPCPPIPNGGRETPFSCLPVFEHAVRPFLDHVEIVISSDWRHHFSLDVLRTKFSSDFHVTVVDTTGHERWRRELEILDWLTDNPRDAWLAVDDLDDHFEDHVDRLIAINRAEGFQAEDGERLRNLADRLIAKALDENFRRER